LASFETSSIAASTDHIMSIMWSPNVVTRELCCCDEDEGRVSTTDLIKSMNCVWDNACSEDQVKRTDVRSVWYPVVRVSNPLRSRCGCPRMFRLW